MKTVVWVSLETEEKVACWLREQFFVVGFVVGVLYRFIRFFFALLETLFIFYLKFCIT